MIPFFLSKLVGTKGIIVIVVVMALGVVSGAALHFIHNYNTLEQNNYQLQANLNTVENALAQAEKTAAVKEQENQTTLAEVRKVALQEQRRISYLQNDTQALSLLRTPTSEDNKCVSNPYVATILDRLRNREAGEPDAGSGNPSDATTTSGTNNAGSTTSNP